MLPLAYAHLDCASEGHSRHRSAQNCSRDIYGNIAKRTNKEAAPLPRVRASTASLAHRQCATGKAIVV